MNSSSMQVLGATMRKLLLGSYSLMEEMRNVCV